MPEPSAVQSFSGPSFAYDLFVSYSHGDPLGAGTTPLKVWTHRLIEELKGDILATSDEIDDVSVCIDQEFDPTLKLTPMIRQHVSSSALLLIVMSPRYLTSAWCKNELEWFNEELQRRENEEGCTLVVRALPTQEELWPAHLKDEDGNSVIGFWFHPRPVREGIRAFGWPSPQPHDRPFYDQLSSLSTVVQRRLRKLKQREALRERAVQPAATLAGPLKVYLHARAADAAKWNEVRKQLVDAGATVFPEAPVEESGERKGLALVQERRRKRIAAYLNCDVLLILRPEPGEWINNELMTVGFDEPREFDSFFGKRLPVAVLDFIGDGQMQDAQLAIKRLSAATAWLPELSQWLAGGAKPEDAGAAPSATQPAA